jgi:hypothetical protein
MVIVTLKARIAFSLARCSQPEIGRSALRIQINSAQSSVLARHYSEIENPHY